MPVKDLLFQMVSFAFPLESVYWTEADDDFDESEMPPKALREETDQRMKELNEHK